MIGVDLKQKSTTISLMFLLLSFVICAQVFAQPCVVVANANKMINSLTANDVERIFLGKMKRWPDGRVVNVVYNDEKMVQTAFSEQYLHRSWRQVSTYWRKKLYSGRSMLPAFVSGHEQVKEYLMSHPDAISYLNSDELDLRVKMIKVKP